MGQTMLEVRGAAKRFVLHAQGAAEIPVFQDLDLSLSAGECVALTGPSGSGKSTLMRMIYANYICPAGEIRVRHDGAWVDVASADPQQVLAVRRRTMGYVSQFLRVIPRVPAVDVVAEPAKAVGLSADEARAKAQALLSRLRVPEALWPLSPMTFSGGEQQRVNIARGFIVDYPVLLLDEPTASLDARNRETVIQLIEEAKQRGAAILGIFHDADVRTRVCTRPFEVEQFRAAA